MSSEETGEDPYEPRERSVMARWRDVLRRAASDARWSAVAWARRNEVFAVAVCMWLTVPVAIYLLCLHRGIAAIAVLCLFAVLFAAADRRYGDGFARTLPESLVVSWLPFVLASVFISMIRYDIEERVTFRTLGFGGWAIVFLVFSALIVGLHYAHAVEFSQPSVWALYHVLVFFVFALLALSVFEASLCFLASCLVPSIVILAWDGGIHWSVRILASGFTIGVVPLQFVPSVLAVDGDDQVRSVEDEQAVRWAVLHDSAVRHPNTGSVPVEVYAREHERTIRGFVAGDWRRNRAEKVLGREVRALRRRERRVSGWRVLR